MWVCGRVHACVRLNARVAWELCFRRVVVIVPSQPSELWVQLGPQSRGSAKPIAEGILPGFLLSVHETPLLVCFLFPQGVPKWLHHLVFEKYVML